MRLLVNLRINIIGFFRDVNNKEIVNDYEKVELINFYFINIGREFVEKFFEVDEFY